MNKFNPAYTVRKAILNDILFFHSSIESISSLTFNLMEFDLIFKSKLKNKSNHLLVLIDQEGKLAGCSIVEFRTILSEKYPYSEIQLFYINPKYRKYFAAEALYEAIEKITVDKNCFKIIVSTMLNATINQRFYARRGFKFIKKTYLKIVL
jgi:ribosomal protein S18 acetylase RimI-like enzyme